MEVSLVQIAFMAKHVGNLSYIWQDQIYYSSKLTISLIGMTLHKGAGWLSSLRGGHQAQPIFQWLDQQNPELNLNHANTCLGSFQGCCGSTMYIVFNKIPGKDMLNTQLLHAVL